MGFHQKALPVVKGVQGNTMQEPVWNEHNRASKRGPDRCYELGIQALQVRQGGRFQIPLSRSQTLPFNAAAGQVPVEVLPDRSQPTNDAALLNALKAV